MGDRQLGYYSRLAMPGQRNKAKIELRSLRIFYTSVVLVAILLFAVYSPQIWNSGAVLTKSRISAVSRLNVVPQIFRTVFEKEAREGAVDDICYLPERKTAFVKPAEHKYKDWYRWKFDEHDIYAYSAFYDDRPASKEPCIRVIIVTPIHRGTRLWCQLWFKYKPCPYVTPVFVHAAGRGETLGGILYEQLMYTCVLPLNSTDIPSHVSFTKQQNDIATSCMPVIEPVSESPMIWGICMVAIREYFPEKQIVEWLEFLQLFGVAEVNIYNTSLSNKLDKVFNYYIEKKFVNVHQMSEVANDTTLKMTDLNSAASLNDCMYRNYKRYRFIVVHDLDELIVPKQFVSYDQLMIDINKHHNLPSDWISYSFRNVYYPLTFEKVPDDSSLYTMQHRNHCQPSGFSSWTKSFIDPRNCLSVFNHYCWIRFPGSREPFTIDVNTSLATSHHYRNELPNYSAGQCGNPSVDTDILVFKPVLREKVRPMLTKL